MVSNCVKPEIQKKPSLDNLFLPPIPRGEDSTSFDHHNHILQLQFSKSNHNEAIVKELMETSFPMRRRDIITNGRFFDVKRKYPFLQEPEYVSLISSYIKQLHASIIIISDT